MTFFARRKLCVTQLLPVVLTAASLIFSATPSSAGAISDDTLDPDVAGVYNVTATNVDNRTNDTYSVDAFPGTGDLRKADLKAGYLVDSAPGAATPQAVNTLIVLNLPTLPSGKIFGPTSNILFTTPDSTVHTNFNLDVYGLTGNLSGSVSTANFFAGALDTTNATLIENNMGKIGEFYSTGNQAFADYLNAAYVAAGPLATTRFAVLRVNPDVNPVSLSNVEDVESFKRGTWTITGTGLPQYGPSAIFAFEDGTLVTVPEAGTLPLFFVAGTLLSTGGLLRLARRKK